MAFVKGKSGNPGGRTKADPELRVLAKKHTKVALDTLIEVMQDTTAPPASRVNAACALLDRGHGKPVQMTEISGKDGTPLIPEVNDNNLARRIAFILASNEIEQPKEVRH